MPRSKYRITPAVGYTADSTFRSEQDLYEKGRIVKEELGVERKYPYTRIMAKMFDAKIGEAATITDLLVVGDDIIPMERPQKTGYLYMGDNPHFQLIQQIVKDEGRITEPALKELYLEEKQYLPNTSTGVEYLESLIKRMHEDFGYLLLEVERQNRSKIRWYKVGRGVRTVNHFVMDVEEGYDPNMVEIWDYCKMNPEGMSFDRIKRHMINQIAWMDTLNEVRAHISFLVNNDYLTEDHNHYRANQPIDPFGER